MRVIGLLVALALAACTQPSSEEHLARARAYLDTTDYPAAIIELKNALVRDKGSAEARWLLGSAYLETGDIPSAEKELRQAEELGWSAEDIRPAMAKTLLALGKVEEALELEHQGLSAPRAARLLSIQAMAALSDGQAANAAALMALALEKDPQQSEVKLAEAVVSTRMGDTDNALKLIKEVQEQAPDNSGAQWLKGQVLLQRGELESARAVFDETIADTENTTLADLIMRALVSVQLGDYDAAQADARAVLKISPSNPTANYIVGVHYFQDGLYLEAISALDLARPVAEQYPLMLYYLSVSHLMENNLGVAAEFSREFYRLVPNDIEGRKLLTAILLQQHDARQAREIIQPVIDQNPADVQALNFKANALLLDDQADIGMLLYARIVQLRPDWRIVPLPLEGEPEWPDPGEREDQTAIPWPEGEGSFPQPDVLAILNDLARRDFDGALEIARSYVSEAAKRDPKGVAPLNVLGRIYFAAGQPDEARKAFEEVVQRSPGDPSANWSLAEMAAGMEQADRARQYYQAVLKYRKNDLETLVKLADFEAGLGDTEAMLSNLKLAAKAHPTAFEPRLKLAEHYMRSGDPEKIEPELAELSPLQRRSPRLLELTALVQLARKEYGRLLTTAKLWVEEAPQSAQAQYMLGVAANATGDGLTGKEALLRAIANDPAYIPALAALAEQTRLNNDREEFEQYLGRLVELAPETPEVLRLRALSAQARGNGLEAVELSQQAFAKSPNTRFALELVSLQKAAGMNEAAYGTLDKWIEAHPQDIDARLFLANSLTLADVGNKAQLQYLAVLELDPDNLTALNNLAWILKKSDPAKALAYIRQAAELAPERPDVLDTLAVVEFYNGEHASAQRNVQRALAAMPDNPTIRYHDAMIAAALGEGERARKTLEALLTDDVGEFPEQAEAQALLDKLKWVKK